MQTFRRLEFTISVRFVADQSPTYGLVLQAFAPGMWNGLWLCHTKKKESCFENPFYAAQGSIEQKKYGYAILKIR